MLNPIVAFVLAIVLVVGYYGYLILEECLRVKKLRKYYKDNCQERTK